MKKVIRDEDLYLIAESLKPEQYRKLKKLVEGRLSDIAGNVKKSLDKAFDWDSVLEAPNPTYLSDEDVDEITQDLLDTAKRNVKKVGRGIKKAGKGIRRLSKMGKDYMDKSFKQACEAPNPLYIDDDEDETIF